MTGKFAIIAAILALPLWFQAKPAQACSTEPFIGGMCVFAGNFAPRGWAMANGALLPISQNTALFSILGTTYGGDGRTTFGLPDLRGRAAIGFGSGPGLSTYRLGETGGVEQVTLTTPQMPSHTHTARADSNFGGTDMPGGNVLARQPFQNRFSTSAPNVDMNTAAITATGGGQAHENRPPFLAVNWIIALTGVFPSRN